MRRTILLLALVVAGCATRPVPPRPAPPVAPTTPVRPIAAADYVAISASRSLLLVRAAELVAQRQPSLAPEARRVKEAHGAIAAQLNFAGRRLGLLPSAELLPVDRAQLEGLERSGDLGAAWRRTLAANLANCERFESRYATSGTSPTLRPVARFALGVCRQELALAR